MTRAALLVAALFALGCPDPMRYVMLPIDGEEIPYSCDALRPNVATFHEDNGGEKTRLYIFGDGRTLIVEMPPDELRAYLRAECG